MENVAEVAASTPAETPQTALDKLSPAEYDNWRLKGELPEPKKEEPAPSQDSSGPSPSEPDPSIKAESDGEGLGKPAPESEAGKAQEPQKGKKHSGTPAPERKAQLAAEIQELLDRRAALRQEVQELESGGRKKDEKKAAPTPATPEPKETDLDEHGQPKYATLEDFTRALVDWQAEQKFSAFKAELAEKEAEADKAKKQAETERQNKAIEESWQKRVKEAGKKHADFQDIVFGEDSAVARIPQGSMMDSYILEADMGAELLYYLAQHGEEVDRITALGPAAQARELAKLELSLSAKKAPDKKFSTTPNPPAEVAGKGIAADDPVAAAVKAGDFEAFQRLENAKDLKRKS